jgi:hypothetical protein
VKKLLFVAILLLGAIPVWADTVTTLDGQVFGGTRVTGLPDVLHILMAGVDAAITTEKIADVSFSSGGVRVKTTSGEDLAGELKTSIGSLKLKTETGETEIPFVKISSVTFSRNVVFDRSGSASVALADGRVLGGDLTRAFPGMIGIEVGGIVTNAKLSSIASIEFGGVTTVVAGSSSVSGSLVTPLPATVELRTQFGYYAIPKELIARMDFSRTSTALPAMGDHGLALGVGVELLNDIPFLLADLSVGSLGFSVGVGFGSFFLSSIPAEVNALWFTGGIRYLVGIPFLESFLRPFFGGGFMGVVVSASAGGETASATFLGTDVTAGLELSLRDLSIPITLFGGGQWTFLAGASGLSPVVGVRVDFGF